MSKSAGKIKMKPAASRNERQEILEQARRVIRIEAEGVSGLLDRLDESFVEAVELVL